MLGRIASPVSNQLAIFLAALLTVLSVPTSHAQQAQPIEAPTATPRATLTTHDLIAMREAARAALFAMHDAQRHWQPQQRPPSESAQIGGETAFCCWALLESGIASQDPRLAPALASMTHPMDGTYAIAARVLVRASLLRKSLGTAEASTRRALEADVAWIASGFSKKSSSWGYAHEPSTRLEDNSIRQFVALALLEATRVGVKSPAALWRSLCHALCDSQTSSGGWTYQGQSRTEPARGSITAGLLAALDGILTLEDVRRDQPLRQKIEKSIERAEHWLATHFEPQANPGHQAWWIFWILALERAAQAHGITEIGSHDWLQECAETLAQQLFVPSATDPSRYSVRERLGAQAGGTRVRAVDLATALLFLDRALRPNAILMWCTAKEAAASRTLARTVTELIEERDEVRAGWWVVDRDALRPEIAQRTAMLYVSRERARTLSDAQCAALRMHAARGGLAVVNLPPPERQTLRARLERAIDLRSAPPMGIDANAVRAWAVEVYGAPRALLVFVDFESKDEQAERAAKALAQLALPYSHDAMGWPTFAREPNTLALSATATIALVSEAAQPEDAAWTEMQSLPALAVIRASATVEAIDALPLPCVAVIHGDSRAVPQAAILDALSRFTSRGGLVLFESPFGAGDFARRCEVAWTEARQVEVARLTPQDVSQAWPTLKLASLRWRPRALLGIDLQQPEQSTTTMLRLRGEKDTRGIAAVFSREDLSFGLLGVPHADCVGMQPEDTRDAISALIELAILRARECGS